MGWADILESELSWREAELASLKLLVLEAQAGSVRQSSLLRALWTMLYAHYEGFCKFAWDFYLENLEQLGVTREVCSPAVARFSLAKKFRELRGDTSSSAFWSVCTAGFDEWMKQQLKFELRLETRYNLWPNLLRDNSSELNLACKVVDQNELKLKTLVGRRNEIAQRKKLLIRSLEEYQPYEETAVLVMHELAVSVLDCLEKKTYLKK